MAFTRFNPVTHLQPLQYMIAKEAIQADTPLQPKTKLDRNLLMSE